MTTSLYDGLISTRAIRRYLPDDIPTDDLNKMFFAATRGPSGHNRQPFRFLVLRKTSESAAARSLLAVGFRKAWEKSRDEPPADDRSRRARMARTMNHFVDHIEDAPLIVFAVYTEIRDRGNITGGASVYPACQNLLLAARSMGYGGVITQWHHPVEQELHEVLGLPDDVLIAATVPLGRPVGSHGPVRRRPLPELVFENTWGSPAPWARDPEGTRYTRG